MNLALLRFLATPDSEHFVTLSATYHS